MLNPGLINELNGTTNVSIVQDLGLNIPEFHYISVAYPINTTEVYTFKLGGSGGTTVATVTVVYTDATKANLSTVTLT